MTVQLAPLAAVVRRDGRGPCDDRWRDGACDPVLTALRAGPLRIVFALARGRGSLARLRDDPRVALTLVGARQRRDHRVRCCLSSVRESLAVEENVAAVALSVERIADHARNDSQVIAGVRWRRLDARSGARDEQILRELRSIGSLSLLTARSRRRRAGGWSCHGCPRSSFSTCRTASSTTGLAPRSRWP